MSHEFYQPGKESRDISQAQEKSVQQEPVRLGFTKSYTETAKAGDTLRRMIKRAYKNGKLYSERQANKAADRVIALFSSDGITKVNPGDRITFRNDSIVLSAFNRQEARFVDTRKKLPTNEASLNYQRREAVKALMDERKELIEETGAVADTPIAQAELSPAQLLAQQQRRAVLWAFINDTEDLKSVISNGQPLTVPALISRKIKGADTRIPAKFQAYEFSEIACNIGNAIDPTHYPTHYLIGLNPQTGEVVLFKAATPYKVRKVNVNGASDLPMLRDALLALAKSQTPPSTPG